MIAFKLKLWISRQLSYTYLAQTSLRNILRKSVHFAKGDLLDIGCGEKPYLSLFKPIVKKYIGLDFRKTAKKRIGQADVIGSALDLPFPDKSFDTVLSTQVLEHVTDPAIMLKEVSRVLRHGGHLILTTPLFWPLHEKPYDYFRYTPFGLKQLVGAAGLKIINIEKTTGLFVTIGQLFSYGLFTEFGTRRGLIVKAALLLICFFIQKFFLFLDFINGGRGDSLDYLVLARKTKK